MLLQFQQQQQQANHQSLIMLISHQAIINILLPFSVLVFYSRLFLF